jgi:hypothetical protein
MILIVLHKIHNIAKLNILKQIMIKLLKQDHKNNWLLI